MLAEARAWAAANLGEPVSLEVVRDRTWARTSRVETAGRTAWLKECAPTHRFEVELVALLADGWPDLVPRVLAHDTARGRLLLADAGTPFEERGNPLQAHAPSFSELCERLSEHGLPAAVQHDDLHHKNAFVDGECLRVIDWGDASRSHPFVSLVVTFRFLEERTGLAPGDPWFARLRDAYLEPWGTGLSEAFALAERAGRFVHAFGWAALRRQLPEGVRPAYDVPFAVVLRRALAAA